MVIKPSEILRTCKAKIDTPEKWTTGVNARDKHGNRVFAESPKAVCFCSSGALLVGWPVTSCDGFQRAVEFLTAEMVEGIPAFNDTHSHSDIMMAWDRAIAAAETAERAQWPFSPGNDPTL